MEWFSCLREAIAFMEDNMEDIKSPQEVADHVHVSCMYLQKGFQILTGYTLGEYMRNRKLYLAATELSATDIPVIDIALRYGYGTPASFDKAFTRFHGVTPMDVRRHRGSIRTFGRIHISIAVQGGESMQFRIEKKEAFRVVGFRRDFDGDTAYQMIPRFWDEMIEKHASNLMNGLPPQSDTERYVQAHHIGEFGVCVDESREPGRFSYLIAGYDKGDEVPEGMQTADIPGGDWAVFDCTMNTLQDTNTRIWREWVPGNTAYEVCGTRTIEWYSPDSEPGPGQKCQIWIPVKKVDKQM